MNRPVIHMSWNETRPFAGSSPVGSAAIGRLLLAGVGFLPVTLIAACAFGVADLRTLATLALLPAVTMGGIAVAIGRTERVVLVRALVAGLIATLLYDLFRFAWLAVGLIDGDPIPHIGQALGIEPAWLTGYVWRYLGNGTGLAVAFMALGLRGVHAGIGYGLFVCGGLLVTLVASPDGETMLFPVEPATVAMAVGGHVIYGAALGHIASRVAARQGTASVTRRRRPVVGAVAVAAAIAVATAGCGGSSDREAADAATTNPAEAASPNAEPAETAGQADACSLLSTEQLESFLVERGVSDATVTRNEALPAITCGYTIDSTEYLGTNFVHVSVFDGGDYDSIITSYPDAEAIEELPDLGERAVRFIAEDGPFVVIHVGAMAIMLWAGGGLDPGEGDYGFGGITALAAQVVERV